MKVREEEEEEEEENGWWWCDASRAASLETTTRQPRACVRRFCWELDDRSCNAAWVALT